MSRGLRALAEGWGAGHPKAMERLEGWDAWGWCRMLVLPLLLAGAAGCHGEGASVMIISHLVTAEAASPFGYQCGEVGGDSSSSSGDRGDDFWTQEKIGDGRVEIIAGAKDEVLARKVYGLPFLNSGKSDRFNVVAPNGDTWTWVVWGGNECQSCPPAPYEPLPGDVSGCPAMPAP